MNWLDGVIRDQRIAQAARFVRPGSRVFDIGCHDGALFRKLGAGLREGVGIDPDLAGPLDGERYRLTPGRFPEDSPLSSDAFDAVCASPSSNTSLRIDVAPSRRTARHASLTQAVRSSSRSRLRASIVCSTSSCG